MRGIGGLGDFCKRNWGSGDGENQGSGKDYLHKDSSTRRFGTCIRDINSITKTGDNQGKRLPLVTPVPRSLGALAAQSESVTRYRKIPLPLNQPSGVPDLSRNRLNVYVCLNFGRGKGIRTLESFGDWRFSRPLVSATHASLCMGRKRLATFLPLVMLRMYC